MFPGLVALDNVALDLRPGEVHALMGENGAGKSTLIKVVTGAYTRDGGSVTLGGDEIWPKTPLEAQGLGISTVYQEVNLVPMLSVAENIWLGREPKVAGMIKWGEVRRKAQEVLGRLGLDVDPDKPVAQCPLAIQQMVAIARAVAVDCQVLILDEPTSSLDDAETARLFEVIERLKAEGVAILFVTHFLNQVFEICDRVTVLRNGELTGEFLVSELTEGALIEHMIGRKLDDVSAWREENSAINSTEILQTRNLGRRRAVTGVDLDVREGEVLGFAGLLGSGRTETLRMVYGADSPDQGEWNGGSTGSVSPARSVRSGLGYCPEDRKGEGIFPEMSIRENVAMVVQVKQGWWRKLSRKQTEELSTRAIKEFDIRTTDGEKPVGQLSGGNQQKAILGRWFAANPKLMLLDEPTRGIDIGTKTEILKLVRDKSSNEGTAFLFVSSEWQEVLQVAHRILAFRDLKLIGEIPKEDFSTRGIAQFIAKGGSGE